MTNLSAMSQQQLSSNRKPPRKLAYIEDKMPNTSLAFLFYKTLYKIDTYLHSLRNIVIRYNSTTSSADKSVERITIKFTIIKIMYFSIALL